jgi:cyclic-di-GMP-binding protein
MPEILSSPPTKPPRAVRSTTMSLPFTDARTCKEWLRSIPLTHAGQAQRLFLDVVRELNRAALPGLEHLTCMELLRDKVAYVQAEQRSKFSGKTIPLAQSELSVWELSRQLVEEMEAGYRKSLEFGKAGDSEVEPHLALITQRVMRYVGLQMLFSGVLYRKFDPVLWTRLHLLWIEAEARGLVLTKVKDSVGSIDGTSSIAAAYIAILLAQQARPEELSARQLDFVDAILKRFANKVEIGLSTVSARAGHLLSVDLFETDGLSNDPGVLPGDHIRFLDVSSLSKSLRARVVKLHEGETPANLGLPTEWTSSDMQFQMRRLHRLWCEPLPPRTAGVVPDRTHATVCFGLEQMHYFLTGTPFEQPGRKRELSRQELNDITMFGKVTEQTMKNLYVEVKFSTESWGIIDESRGGIRLLRPATTTQGMAIGRLVGVRMTPQSPWMAARVCALEDVQGSIQVSLAFLPGTLSAVGVRQADLRNRPGAQFVPGIMLGAMPALGTEESLLIPSGFVPPGRGMDISLPGQAQSKEITVHEVAERGHDFDRVSFY